jgi:hypothetical protein
MENLEHKLIEVTKLLLEAQVRRDKASALFAKYSRDLQELKDKFDSIEADMLNEIKNSTNDNESL